MDVRIGVTRTAKEIEVDMGDGVDKEAVQKEIDKVLADGSGSLAHRQKGPQSRHSGHQVAYVEVGAEGGERRMGFVG